MPLPFFRNRTDQELQDLLMAHADALAAGTLELDTLLEHYDDAPLSQVEDLLTLAESISRVMTQVSPSEQFVDRLYHELRAADIPAEPSLWGQLRTLSPRTQIAAGIGGATLTAGVVLLASRPLLAVWDGWRSRRLASTA
jgi:hypothetical protein